MCLSVGRKCTDAAVNSGAFYRKEDCGEVLKRRIFETDKSELGRGSRHKEGNGECRLC